MIKKSTPIKKFMEKKHFLKVKKITFLHKKTLTFEISQHVFYYLKLFIV